MRKLSALLSISVLLLLFVSCSLETIKIGAFLSLTGATSAYGVSAANAIKMAEDEVNRDHGINGYLVEIEIEDDPSNTDEVPGIFNHSARMLFDAFRRAKSHESADVRDALAQTKDFVGVTGKITLDANRNAQAPVYILHIEGGKFTLQH